MTKKKCQKNPPNRRNFPSNSLIFPQFFRHAKQIQLATNLQWRLHFTIATSWMSSSMIFIALQCCQCSTMGLIFEVSPSKCLLDMDIRFEEVILKIPCLVEYDLTETFFRNIVTFEQCHYHLLSYICEYFMFLSFLVKIEKDAIILVDSKIIVNYMGDPCVVARCLKTSAQLSTRGS